MFTDFFFAITEHIYLSGQISRIWKNEKKNKLHLKDIKFLSEAATELKISL
jgi:hypothetical protein